MCKTFKGIFAPTRLSASDSQHSNRKRNCAFVGVLEFTGVCNVVLGDRAFFLAAAFLMAIWGMRPLHRKTYFKVNGTKFTIPSIYFDIRL